MFIPLGGYFITMIHFPLFLHYSFISEIVFYSFLFFIFDSCSEMLKLQKLFFLMKNSLKMKDLNRKYYPGDVHMLNF